MVSHAIRVCTLALLCAAAGCRTARQDEGARTPELGKDDLRFAKALAHFGQGLLDEEEIGYGSEAARRHFERAAELDPETHRLSVKAALNAYQQDPERAIASLKQSCEANPDDFQPWVDLAFICHIAGHKDEAETYYRRALDVDDSRGAVYLTLVRLLYSENEDEKAVRVLKDGVAKVEDPTPLFTTAYTRAVSLIRSGEMEQALPALHFLATEAATPRQHFHHLLGEVYLELGQERKAIRHLKKATRGDHPSANAFRKYARTMMPEKMSRAIRVLKQAHSRLPENTDILFDLEYAYRQQEAFDKASEVLDKIHKLFEQSDKKEIELRFYLHYGSVCERAGRFEQAEQVFEECLSVYPDAHQALNYLAYMWAEKGMHLEKALGYVKRALKIEPENGAYLDTLGWIYYRQNNYGLARKEIRKALDVMPEDPTITEHMGDVLKALGNTQEAVRLWEQSFTLDVSNDTLADKLMKHGIDVEALRRQAADPPPTSD